MYGKPDSTGSARALWRNSQPYTEILLSILWWCKFRPVAERHQWNVWFCKRDDKTSSEYSPSQLCAATVALVLCTKMSVQSLSVVLSAAVTVFLSVNNIGSIIYILMKFLLLNVILARRHMWWSDKKRSYKTVVHECILSFKSRHCSFVRRKSLFCFKL